MKNSVGKAIQVLRIEKKLKQTYMAYKLNMTVESYRNIEHGRVDINIKKLQIIANIYSMPISSIISLAESFTVKD